MHENTSLSQNLDTLFSDLHNLVKSDTVLGTPVSVGDKTLVPVMAVTLGYGTTGMGTKMGNNNNTSASSNGIGLGARVSTSAVMVIDKDSVTMHPVTEKGNMATMMEKIPQALAGIGQSMTGMGQGQQQGQQQNQAQSQQGGQQSQQKNS